MWGSNGSGELADGTNSNKFSPALIGSDTNWAFISLGIYRSCALKSTNTVWSSGSYTGDGTYSTRNVPTLISCSSLATDQFNLNNLITLYPNPTKDIINIDKGNLLISKILIFDILGKKILEEYKVSSKLDVSHLDKGIYMIEIHSEYKIFKSKFIKM